MTTYRQSVKATAGLIIGILLAIAVVYLLPRNEQHEFDGRPYLDTDSKPLAQRKETAQEENASMSKEAANAKPLPDESHSSSDLGSFMLLQDGRKGFLDPETGELGGWTFWTPRQKAILGLDQDMQYTVYDEYDQVALENLVGHGDFLAMWHLSREIADDDPERAESLWLDVVAITGKPGVLIKDSSEWAQHARDFDKYMTYEYLALELGYGNALVREQFMISQLGQDRADAAKAEAMRMLEFVIERRRELTGKELIISERVVYEKPVEAPPPPVRREE